MKLTDIHTQFKTDKGTAHDYIGWYEQTFSDRRTDEMNVLEVGVLFGGSLKMWEHYFENSNIYGVEDFSQEDGQWHYQYEPVDGDAVMEDVNSHERITLFNFDCENLNHIQEHFGDLTFDIIIDDANHKLTQQMKNAENYIPYLRDGGIYICEDVQTAQGAKELCDFITELYPGAQTHVIECDLNKKSDDRLVVVA
jgi:hypothetical protein